jgi:putative methyltransferase (TIGR04325 family)
MRAILKVAAEELGRVPLLRHSLLLAHKRRFDRAKGYRRLFCGLYPDWATAMRDVPRDRPLGYDNEPSAGRLIDERCQVYPSDYPILFWLQKLLPELRAVFDWGGNVGMSYYGFRRYIDYPEALRWVINDVPAVVALGRKIAAEEGARSLVFTTGFEELAQADLLLAAGCLQLIEDPWTPLRTASQLPRHLLINKLPVFDHRSAVTLHNMGTAIMPYHLFNRVEFVASLEDLGYRLIDSWTNPYGCRIPLHPSHSIAAYSGFYFRRGGDGDAATV